MTILISKHSKKMPCANHEERRRANYHISSNVSTSQPRKSCHHLHELSWFKDSLFQRSKLLAYILHIF